MSNEAFRWLWTLFDAITIPALREPLTEFSATVKSATGIWFHPSTWQSAFLLSFAALVLATLRYRTR